MAKDKFSCATCSKDIPLIRIVTLVDEAYYKGYAVVNMEIGMHSNKRYFCSIDCIKKHDFVRHPIKEEYLYNEETEF